MLTPKHLRTLGEILSQETVGTLPSLADYMSAAVEGKPTIVSETIRISGNGKLEASQPQGPKAYANRLKVRAIVRTLTRAAKAELPIGQNTKAWLGEVLRASDMAQEAADVLRRT